MLLDYRLSPILCGLALRLRLAKNKDNIQKQSI